MSTAPTPQPLATKPQQMVFRVCKSLCSLAWTGLSDTASGVVVQEKPGEPQGWQLSCRSCSVMLHTVRCASQLSMCACPIDSAPCSKWTCASGAHCRMAWRCPTIHTQTQHMHVLLCHRGPCVPRLPLHGCPCGAGAWRALGELPWTRLGTCWWLAQQLLVVWKRWFPMPCHYM